MELSFPYTWSNRNASDEALISSALEHPDFRDLTRLSARFGIHRMEQAAERMIEEGRIGERFAPDIRRMLGNIRIAMERCGYVDGDGSRAAENQEG